MTTMRRYYENTTASVSEMCDQYDAAMRVSSTTALAGDSDARTGTACRRRARGETTHSAGHR